MPIYEAKCKRCGKQQDYMASIENMYQTPVCCGQPMEKVILTAPSGFVDSPAHMSQYKHLYANKT